jgi:tetratricopeptide (TPR) repeat protein
VHAIENAATPVLGLNTNVRTRCEPMPKIIGVSRGAQAWQEAQKVILSYLTAGDLARAEQEIEVFLGTEPHKRFRSEALALRATIREDRDDLDGAESDLLNAADLTTKADYHRYTLALSLGNLYERRKNPDQALLWYREAIEITIEDPSTSAGTAILGLLRIRGEQPSSEDLDLCWRAAHQSWKLLRLPGDPYANNLARTAEMLVQAQGRPLPPPTG